MGVVKCLGCVIVLDLVVLGWFVVIYYNGFKDVVDYLKGEIEVFGGYVEIV